MKRRSTLLFLLLIFLFSIISFAKPITFSAIFNSTTEFTVVPGRHPKAVCFAEYDSEGMVKIGWDSLSIVSTSSFDDFLQVTACGFLEGYVTHTKIWQNFVRRYYFLLLLLLFFPSRLWFVFDTRKKNARTHARTQVNMKYPRTLKPRVEQFLKENEEWIEKQRSGTPTESYWKQIELLGEQVKAMWR